MKLINLMITLGILTIATPAWADLNIVATTPDLAAIAKDVGGSYTRVKSMSAANQDPHYVDPKPSLTLMLNRADILVVNGLELEVGWLPPLQTNARNPRIQTGGAGYLDASKHVQLLGAARGKIDRTQGDIHPGGNPHYMHDPRAAARVALALGERMASLDAEHAAAYRANAERVADTLKRLANQQRERFSKLPTGKRTIVAYHKSLAYVLDWLQLSEVITVEPKPGIAPNPGHVAKVLKTMRGNKVELIIQEAFYPRKTSDTLARMARGRVAVIPGGTNFQGGESYVDRAKRTAEVIYDAIQK